MKADLIERRQRMLSLKGMGISLSNCVKELAPQYHVSTRAIYLDWSHRKDWLDAIIDMKDPQTFFLELLASHKDIHSKAAWEYLHADNNAARVGALRLMRDINRDLWEMVIFSDLAKRIEALESQKGGTSET